MDNEALVSSLYINGSSGTLKAGSGLELDGDTISTDNTVVRTSGSQVIGGDKTFTGTVTLENSVIHNSTSFSTRDGIIEQNRDNTTDLADYGSYGVYTDGTEKYRGLINKAGTDKFYFFNNQTMKPASVLDLSTQDLATCVVRDPTAPQEASTKNYVDAIENSKLNLTGGTMTGAIDMSSNKITNVGNASVSTDALNLGTGDGRYARLSQNNTFTNENTFEERVLISTGNNSDTVLLHGSDNNYLTFRVDGLKWSMRSGGSTLPLAMSQGTNEICDFSTSGCGFNYDIDLKDNSINNVDTLQFNQDTQNKILLYGTDTDYSIGVDMQTELYMKTGGQFNIYRSTTPIFQIATDGDVTIPDGQLIMNNNRIVGVPTTPLLSNEAASKSYVDDNAFDATANIDFTGDVTFANNVNMLTNRITNLNNPVNNADAATKSYVDSVAGGSSLIARFETGHQVASGSSFTSSSLQNLTSGWNSHSLAAGAGKYLVTAYVRGSLSGGDPTHAPELSLRVGATNVTVANVIPAFYAPISNDLATNSDVNTTMQYVLTVPIAVGSNFLSTVLQMNTRNRSFTYEVIYTCKFLE